MPSHLRTCLLAIAATLLLLIGCGGGGSSPAVVPDFRSGLTVTVRWPEPTRLIPQASNSIRVTVYHGSSAVAGVIVRRPATGNTSTATIDVLPVGDLRAVAEAFPDESGGGVAQARGEIPFRTEAGETATIGLTMATTITRLAILPENAKVEIDDQLQLSALGVDRFGNYVLTSPNTMSWSANDSDIAITARGRVTGRRAGRASVRVTDSETGLSVGEEIECIKIRVKQITLSGDAGCVLTGEGLDLNAAAFGFSGSLSPAFSDWRWGLRAGSVGSLSTSGPRATFSSSSPGEAEIAVTLYSDKYEEAAAVWELLVQPREASGTLNVSNSGNASIIVSLGSSEARLGAGESRSLPISLSVGSSATLRAEIASGGDDAQANVSFSIDGGEGIDGEDILVFSGGSRSTSISLSGSSSSGSTTIEGRNPCG